MHFIRRETDDEAAMLEAVTVLVKARIRFEACPLPCNSWQIAVPFNKWELIEDQFIKILKLY